MDPESQLALELGKAIGRIDEAGGKIDGLTTVVGGVRGELTDMNGMMIDFARRTAATEEWAANHDKHHKSHSPLFTKGGTLRVLGWFASMAIAGGAVAGIVHTVLDTYQ